MVSEIEYTNLSGISGPLIFVDGIKGVGYGDIVEIRDASGGVRIGQTLEVDEGRAVVQVFEGTSGLSVSQTRVTFVGKALEIPVDRNMLGRVFDGLGRPIDGAPQVISDKM
ncbi:MAG: V-type ATP synthase subunit B, partial [Smithella sp.]